MNSGKTKNDGLNSFGGKLKSPPSPHDLDVLQVMNIRSNTLLENLLEMPYPLDKGL